MQRYEAAKSFVEKVKYLACLPAEEVTDTFAELVNQLSRHPPVQSLTNPATTVKLIDIFALFIDYYRRIWLKMIKPEKFSVYGEEHRTNNDTERENRSWHEICGNHPRTINFLGLL